MILYSRSPNIGMTIRSVVHTCLQDDFILYSSGGRYVTTYVVVGTFIFRTDAINTRRSLDIQ